MARAEELGVGQSLSFLRDVDAINLRRRGRVLEILVEELGDLTGKTIAVWGMAFKPDSDDIRDSPALDITESLARAGAKVVAADPAALVPAQRRLAQSGLSDSISLTDDHLAAARNADALVIATEWKQFSEASPLEVAGLLATALVIDGRNCLDSDAWKKAGFRYRGMGRS